MEDENRKTRFTNILIKAIIVIIFILFTAWLISFSHKGINNSLNVLTDQIFADNLDRMKEVGKEYFTTERLPQKVGEVKTLTLAKMYDSKYILELKDKYGNYCSAANSYVSVEKFDTEYQMKVYLECGDNSDYIISIMGCYDYCSSTICEKKDTTEIKGSDIDTKNYQYEYKRYTGGSWTDYGEWSEWSKTSITSTNYRQVETKTVNEEYSYNKEVQKTDYVSLILTCPSGYKMTNDGTKCYKVTNETVYTSPECPSTYDGGKFTSRDGFTCNYTKAEQKTTDPVCPSTYDGGKFTSRDGFTCNYTVTSQSCQDVASGQSCQQVQTGTTQSCYQVQVGSQITSSCRGCGKVEVPVYETRCSTVPTYENKCETTYEKKCENISKTVTTTATCPSGYTKSGNSCVANTSKNITTSATCKTGYTQTADKSTCYKGNSKTIYSDFNKSCPTDYAITSDGTKCYKNYTVIETVKEYREVTYYRYRIREYIDGSVDYKWSYSKEDKNLLDAGYTLTGNVREVK